jgi:peroxiredoxin (alkyl hydroperoxide reductase subunit C)
MPVEIGKEAPDFSADAYCRGEQRRVHLRDYRGRWVLLFFYLRDFTPV